MFTNTIPNIVIIKTVIMASRKLQIRHYDFLVCFILKFCRTKSNGMQFEAT